MLTDLRQQGNGNVSINQVNNQSLSYYMEATLTWFISTFLPIQSENLLKYRWTQTTKNEIFVA